jgi:DNA-binding transcriptional LysR family regulator
MDKFSAMKDFVRVVEAGSFTKAADSMGVPKARLTRAVQLLEQLLRTQLLNRTSRRVVVTPAGSAYYEHAARMLDEIEDFDSRMLQTMTQPRGRLRIDVPGTVANAILIPAIEDFCVRYPDIQVHVGVSDRPADLIGENIDCVLRFGDVKEPSLVARRLGEVQGVLCAAPAYLKRVGIPAHPSDLENGRHRVVSYFSSGSVRDYVLLRRTERYKLAPTSTIAVNDVATLLSAALAGVGIAAASIVQATPHLEGGRLQVVLPEWSAGTWPLYVVYPPTRHVSAKLRVFIDWIAELCTRTLATPRAIGSAP